MLALEVVAKIIYYKLKVNFTSSAARTKVYLYVAHCDLRAQ